MVRGVRVWGVTRPPVMGTALPCLRWWHHRRERVTSPTVGHRAGAPGTTGQDQHEDKTRKKGTHLHGAHDNALRPLLPTDSLCAGNPRRRGKTDGRGGTRALSVLWLTPERHGKAFPRQTSRM
ncbi:hypothetical protein DDE01_18710 [Desulfovibrio desulfuricans]|nr:hypothetical protein DDE01_18710 [Desulfovibrio desulfuricans]